MAKRSKNKRNSVLPGIYNLKKFKGRSVRLQILYRNYSWPETIKGVLLGFDAETIRIRRYGQWFFTRDETYGRETISSIGLLSK